MIKKIIFSLLLFVAASTLAMEKTNIIDMQKDQPLPTISQTDKFTLFNNLPPELQVRIIWSNLRELLINRKFIELKNNRLVSQDFISYHLKKKLLKIVYKINQNEELSPISSTNMAKLILNYDKAQQLHQEDPSLIPDCFENQDVNFNKMMSAVYRQDIAKLKELIRNGADLNVKNNGLLHTPVALIIAAYQGYAKIVNTLIQAGADINIPDAWGNTALMTV